jgi:hypothetical protein
MDGENPDEGFARARHGQNLTLRDGDEESAGSAQGNP